MSMHEESKKKHLTTDATMNSDNTPVYEQGLWPFLIKLDKNCEIQFIKNLILKLLTFVTWSYIFKRKVKIEVFLWAKKGIWSSPARVTSNLLTKFSAKHVSTHGMCVPHWVETCFAEKLVNKLMLLLRVMIKSPFLLKNPLQFLL